MVLCKSNFSEGTYICSKLTNYKNWCVKMNIYHIFIIKLNSQEKKFIPLRKVLIEKSTYPNNDFPTIFFLKWFPYDDFLIITKKMIEKSL